MIPIYTQPFVYFVYFVVPNSDSGFQNQRNQWLKNLTYRFHLSFWYQGVTTGGGVALGGEMSRKPRNSISLV
jgi:hypothetical protein